MDLERPSDVRAREAPEAFGAFVRAKVHVSATADRIHVAFRARQGVADGRPDPTGSLTWPGLLVGEAYVTVPEPASRRGAR